MANKTISQLANINILSEDATKWASSLMLVSSPSASSYNISLGQVAKAVFDINPPKSELGAPEGVFPLKNPSHTFKFVDVTERELNFKTLYFDRFYGWCEAWALEYQVNVKICIIALWSLDSKTWVRGARRDLTNNQHHAVPVNTHLSGAIPEEDKNRIQQYEFLDLAASLSLSYQ